MLSRHIQRPHHRHWHDKDEYVRHKTQRRNGKVKWILIETVVLDLMLPKATNRQTLKQKAEQGAHEA